MLRAIEGNKGGKRWQLVCHCVAILNRMIQESLTETVTFQQRFQSGKGVNHVDVLGKNVPSRENNTDKGMRECCT